MIAGGVAVLLSITGADAFAPIGPPDERRVIYQCWTLDNIPEAPDIPYVLTDDFIWLVLDSQDASVAPFLGRFLWWYTKADIIFSDRYHAWRRFDVFGGATNQILVGPDGAAQYRLAHVKDEASVYATYALQCRKGGAYDSAFGKAQRP